MLMTPEVMSAFIKGDLGPALHNAELDNLKMMINDDNRLMINSVADRVPSKSKRMPQNKTSRYSPIQ